MKMVLLVFLIVTGVAVSGCERTQEDSKARLADKATSAGAQAQTRWCTKEQVAAGAELYQESCATCHKENAEGSSNWRQRDAGGVLRPPPLNGTAHTWHHPLKALRTVVKRCGVPVGGSMPAFADKLTDAQIDATLAWVRSLWPNEIYNMWLERDMNS